MQHTEPTSILELLVTGLPSVLALIFCLFVLTRVTWSVTVIHYDMIIYPHPTFSWIGTRLNKPMIVVSPFTKQEQLLRIQVHTNHLHGADQEKGRSWASKSWTANEGIQNFLVACTVCAV